jgi:hypothetical protein
MSRPAGSIVRGFFKAAPDIRQNGPAAGAGYVLRTRLKVKAGGNRAGPMVRSRRACLDWSKSTVRLAGVAGLPQASDINGCDGKRIFANPRKAAVNPINCRTNHQVFERDDGLFEIGLSDPSGPFESRRFAEAVANRDTGDPPPKRRRPGSGKPGRYSLVRDAAATQTYAKAESLSSPALRGPAVLAGWYAVTADSSVVGLFGTRLEAAQASGSRA